MKRVEGLRDSDSLMTELKMVKDALAVAINKNTTMEQEVSWFRNLVGQERMEKAKARQMEKYSDEQTRAAKSESAKLKSELEGKEREVSQIHFRY
jgi:hypothetical protein